MGPPRVHGNLGCLAGACDFKQNISQPRGVAALKVKGLAEYPSLVPTARVRRARAIVLDLADIEDSLMAVRQARRHAGTRTSYLVLLSEYMNGSYSGEQAPSTTNPSGGSPRRLPAPNPVRGSPRPATETRRE
jgi:hypothetical protein